MGQSSKSSGVSTIGTVPSGASGGIEEETGAGSVAYTGNGSKMNSKAGSDGWDWMGCVCVQGKKS